MFREKSLIRHWLRVMTHVLLIASIAASVSALAKLVSPHSVAAAGEGVSVEASVTVTDDKAVSLAPVPGATVHFIVGNKVRVTAFGIPADLSLGVTGGRFWVSGIPEIAIGAYSNQAAGAVSPHNPDWVWKFTVDTSSNNTNTVITPSDGLVTKTSAPTFNWTSLVNPAIIQYAFEVSSSRDFSTVLLRVDKYTADVTSYTLTQGQALTNGVYYWRLIAKGTLWVVGMPSWLNISQYNPLITALPTITKVETADGKLTVNYVYTVYPPPPPGGGGGGGGGVPPVVTPPGTTPLMTNAGVLTALATAVSIDAKAQLNLPAGTKALTKDGAPLEKITLAEMASPPAAPAGSKFISLVYDFGPDGATFDPAIDVVLAYDPAATEGRLVVASSDATGVWIPLDNIVVNKSNHTVSGKAKHFSAFAVMASANPASFMVSDVSVSPAEGTVNENGTIGVLVKNTGDVSGSYEVVLKINGVKVDATTVTMGGGSSTTVKFNVARNTAGTYAVDINGLTGKFVVRAASSPPSPAAFSVGAPAISPAEGGIKENIAISTVVKNTGGLTGIYTVTLKIDGVKIEDKDVTLASGASQKVDFTVSRDAAGTYVVDVNGLTGKFIVRAPLAPEPNSPVPVKSLNWLLMGSIIIVVVIIGVTIPLIIRRRTS